MGRIAHRRQRAERHRQRQAKIARARSESSASVVSPPPSKNDLPAPANGFEAQEPPTLPSAPGPLRARVDEWALVEDNRALLDWLDAPDEPTAIVQTTPGALLAPVAERALEYAKQSRSKSTRRSYKRQWGAFCAWCAANDVPSLPAAPAVVALYLTAKADEWSVATLSQALSAIGHYHRQANEPSPHAAREVTNVWDGIKRTKGVAPKRALPLTPDQLRAMVIGLKPGLTGVRDRALLCLGLAGAFRRSELVALNVDDVDFVEDGVAVLVRSSKTDQEAKGEAVGVAFGDDRTTCAVRALRDWLAVSGIVEGAVFRGVQNGKLSDMRLLGKDVALILKRAATRVGIDVDRLSGHSLRAGLATTAAKRGKSLHAIAKQGRWKSMNTVAIYIRDVELFEDNASSGIGL